MAEVFSFQNQPKKSQAKEAPGDVISFEKVARQARQESPAIRHARHCRRIRHAFEDIMSDAEACLPDHSTRLIFQQLFSVADQKFDLRLREFLP